mmetsp:Transcript_35905/g.106449  ORF Transcript_35905/g.106449 Transcript_35905/m.106449 type:complete len:252 (-) Transcript_35905:376-1131(-)
MMWKPSVSETALSSCALSLDFVVYSGSSRWLKQVCADGSRSSSEPLREMTKERLPSPLIGTRSEPVQKKRNFFFISSGSSWITSHSSAMHGLSQEKPSSYCVTRSSASKSRFGEPHSSSSSSSHRKSWIASPPQTDSKPRRKASDCVATESTRRYCVYSRTYSARLAPVTGTSPPPSTRSKTFRSPNSSYVTCMHSAKVSSTCSAGAKSSSCCSERPTSGKARCRSGTPSGCRISFLYTTCGKRTSRMTPL